jgi:hypothetical protein
LRHVIHENKLDAFVGSALVRIGCGDRIGRNADNDVGVESHDGFDIGNLLFSREIGIRGCDDLDPEVVECVSEAL